MTLVPIIEKLAVTAVLGMMVKFTGLMTPPLPQRADVELEEASKLVCKTGFKAGKTPVSLVVGAKPGCVNIAAATAGKKLFTATTKTCFACHGTYGPNPVSQTNTNLRNQGFTLKPADIVTAFNLHADQMLGSTITAKDAKTISAYLQTIK